MKIVMKVGQGESFCTLGSPIAKMLLPSKTLAPVLLCCGGSGETEARPAGPWSLRSLLG